MANIDDLQRQHEAQLGAWLEKRTGQGAESDWALVRALAHKAVHVAAERRASEYCAVATLLAEMIQHAHQLMHPGDRGGGSGVVH